MNNQRTYGIEIEAASKVNKQEVAARINAAFRQAGMDHTATVNGYTHNTDGANTKRWEVQYDMSIDTDRVYTNRVEIVSPVLKGEDGFKAIEVVCNAVDGILKVNKSCGLHVHHYIGSGMDLDRVAERWLDIEAAVMQALPPSRRSNRFCKSMRKPGTTRRRAIEIASRDRYHTLNLTSYAIRNTVEFRCHSGTTESKKIKNWVLATQGIIEAAVAGIEPRNRAIDGVAEFIAGAALNAEDYEAIRGKRHSNSAAVRILDGIIETGRYTKKEALEEAVRQGATRKTAYTRLCEATNDKWNKQRTRVVVDADGKLKFDETAQADADFAAAAEWLKARHDHFQAAA